MHKTIICSLQTRICQLTPDAKEKETGCLYYQKTRLTLHGWRNNSANPVTYHVIHVYSRDLA
jgi:hypothetical protein